MGKAYSYNVRPGEVISIPDDQVSNIRAAGQFAIISAPGFKKAKPTVNKKVIKKEAPANPVRVVKHPPVSTPVQEEEVDVVVEEDFVDVDPEEETKVLPQVEEKEEEHVHTEECAEKCVDYTSIRKAGLKDMCKDRGLHVSGNRDDLIARLVAFDKGVILDK